MNENGTRSHGWSGILFLPVIPNPHSLNSNSRILSICKKELKSKSATHIPLHLNALRETSRLSV